MAIHDVKKLSWNKISKILWVYVDGDMNNRAALFCEKEEDIPSKIEEYTRELNEREDPPEMPRKYSKLKICLGLQELGKLQDFQTWLSQSGYEFLFTQAQELSSENKMFSAGVEMVKNALNLSDEKVKIILEQSVIED